MGRRSRQRALHHSERGEITRDRMARVQVSDEVWASFRAGLGVTPVNIALGKLVEREVGRQRRRTADDAQEAQAAIEDARSVANELETLALRLERTTASGGGSL